MKLNQNSWYAWYYQNLYGYKLPQSLCKFLWLEILAIILFPIIWIQVLINMCITDEERLPPIFAFLLYFLNVIGACILAEIFKLHSSYNIIWLNFLGVVPIVILAGVIGLIIYLIKVLVEYISDLYSRYKPIKEYKESKPNWFKEGIKAFFSKYCPRIDWE